MTKKEKSAEKGKGNEKGKKEIEAQNLPFSYVIYFPHDFLIGYPFFWLFTVSFYLEQIVFSVVSSKYNNSFHNFSFLPLLTQAKAIFAQGSVWHFCGPLGQLEYRVKYRQGCFDSVFKTHIFQHEGILWLSDFHYITIISDRMINGTLLCMYIVKDSMYILVFAVPQHLSLSKIKEQFYDKGNKMQAIAKDCFSQELFSSVQKMPIDFSIIRGIA